MAITFNQTAERFEKWGTDITVEFFDDGIYVTTKIFRKGKDVLAQMAKACSNIQEGIDEAKLPTPMDKAKEIEKHFETKMSLTKDEFERLELTGKIEVEVEK